MFNPIINEKSSSAKTRKWLPRNAREQRMRSIISHLRREMKRRNDRLKRAKKAQALMEKKAAKLEKVKRQRILAIERVKLARIRNAMKEKSKHKDNSKKDT